MTTECEHGDPRPGHCALCRHRERLLIEPHKYRPIPRPTARAVPRPIWFDALVEQAREEARR